MTTKELRIKFIDGFSFNSWPALYEVDAETYGNVCQEIFDFKLRYAKTLPLNTISISVGPNKGIMYNGVELILKGK
jgi:hypothetical protein